MTFDDIVADIHALMKKLENFERKYGVLSETFYESYMKGEEPANEDWVNDWALWSGTYKVMLRRKEQYRAAIRILQNEHTELMQIIERTSRHEPLSISA